MSRREPGMAWSPIVKGSYLDDLGPPPLYYRVNIDPYVESDYVANLDPNNFMQFLTSKDAVLVYFYTPGDSDNDWLKNEVAQAACSTQRPNHAFAAVNCCREKELCMANKVSQTPRFNMYSKGYYVGSLRDVCGLTASVLRQYVELSPLLTKPKGPLDDDY